MQCYFWIGPACHMRNWDETFQDRSDVRNQSGQNQCWKQFKPWDCLLNKCCNSCLRCQNLRYVSSAVSILKYATAAYALTDASRSLVDLSTTPALWHQRRSIATKTKSLFISSPTIMKFLHKVLIFIFILQNVIFECSIQKKRAGGEANATRVNLNTIILGSSLKGHQTRGILGHHDHLQLQKFLERLSICPLRVQSCGTWIWRGHICNGFWQSFSEGPPLCLAEASVLNHSHFSCLFNLTKNWVNGPGNALLPLLLLHLPRPFQLH